MTTLRKTALLLIGGALCTILVVVVRFHRSAGPQRVLRREAARRALPRAHTNPTTTKQLANPSSAAAAIAPPVNHSMPPARRHTRARARTLVCLIGSARGGEETWRSIHRHLVLPNNADLALFLPEADRNAGALVALATDPSLVFRQREHDDWGDALDGIAAAVHARDARWARAMPAEAGSGDRDPDMEFYARLKAAPNAATTTWRDILRTGRSFAPRAGEGAHRDPKKAREMALSNSGVFGGVYFAGRRLPGSGAIVGAQRHFVSRVLVERGLLERYDRFVVPVEITGICRALFLDWTLRFSQLSISHRLWRVLFSFPRVFALRIPRLAGRGTTSAICVTSTSGPWTGGKFGYRCRGRKTTAAFAIVSLRAAPATSSGASTPPRRSWPTRVVLWTAAGPFDPRRLY